MSGEMQKNYFLSDECKSEADYYRSYFEGLEFMKAMSFATKKFLCEFKLSILEEKIKKEEKSLYQGSRSLTNPEG